MQIKTLVVLMMLGLLWGCGPSEQKPQHSISSPATSKVQVSFEQRIKACTICHGNESGSLSHVFPNITGLSKEYLLKQLLDYKTGRRMEFIMNAMVREHSDDELEKLARYFAEQARATVPPSKDRQSVALGMKIYQQGISQNKVRPCASCHGARGEGKVMDTSIVPALAGQKVDYLKMQLNHFKYLIRDNDPEKIMRNAVEKVSDTDLLAVVEYISTLK